MENQTNTSEVVKFSKRQNTNYNRFVRVKSRIADTLSTAFMFRSTHAEVLELLGKIYDTTDYSKLTQYARGYIRGQVEHTMNSWYRHQEWRLFYEGKLVLSSEVPNIDYSRVDTNKSTHVWKSRDGKPIKGFGRPIDDSEIP